MATDECRWISPYVKVGNKSDGQEQFMGEEQREGNAMIIGTAKHSKKFTALRWSVLVEHTKQQLQNPPKPKPVFTQLLQLLCKWLRDLLAEAKPSQSSIREHLLSPPAGRDSPRCAGNDDDDVQPQLHASLSSPRWTAALQDTCYKSLPSLRNSELEVQLLCDTGTAISRSFRYPGPV